MKHRISVLVLGSLLVLTTSAFGGWNPQVSNVATNLYDVDCVSADLAWAVGAGGVILHTTDGGQNWGQQTSGTNQDLYGVDFTDLQNGWVVGSGPTILHTTNGGADWLPQTPGTVNNLLDVAFADQNRGWASGVSGTIIGTTNGGSSWNSEINGVWGWFWGVTAASPTNAWVIGGDWFNHVAPVYHYNGTSWTHQYDITTTQSGQGISAANETAVWAVGDSGMIAHTTNGGTNWSNQTSGIRVMVNHPCAVSANQCWVSAMGGTILHTANGGNLWTPETTSVGDDLYGIVMFDSSIGWSVGTNGRILHRSAGGSVVEEPSPAALRPAVALFPNPVRSELRLMFAGQESGGLRSTTVRLYDAGGRFREMLYSGAAAHELRLSVARLPAGAYFLTVATSDHRGAVRFLKTE